MKKIMFFAAICVALVACNKEEIVNTFPNNGGLTTLTATIDIPQTKVAPDTDDLASGTGTLDFHWENGDSVTVYVGNETPTIFKASSISEDEKTATFVGEGTPLDGDGVLYLGDYSFNDKIGYATKYLEGSFRPFAEGAVSAGGASFSLTSIYPVLKLQLSGTVKINAIELDADGSNDSYMFFDTPLQLGSTAVTVYFPLKTITNGETSASLKFYNENDALVFKKNTKKAFKYNKIYTMPALTVNAHYFENSVDCGEGIKIGDVVWAPVNCGYDETNYPYGKLYQWGRKDGCGYNTTWTNLKPQTVTAETPIQSIKEGPISAGDENASEFYKNGTSPSDWLSTQNNYRWNSATGDNGPDKTTAVTPIKTTYDPCPAGWRVPTYYELSQLLNTKMSTAFSTGDGTISGYRFGTEENNIFLPAAGYRSYYSGDAYDRGDYGIYWSSSVSGDDAWALGFFDDDAVVNYDYRAGGYSVRCVQE